MSEAVPATPPARRGPGRRSWRGAVAMVVALSGVALVAVACSSDPDAAPVPAEPTTGRTESGAGTRPPCDRSPADPPAAIGLADAPSDLDITSFDGTTIRTHWFPRPGATAEQPAPTVLMGPGWSLPGDTNVEAVGVLGAINIGSLHAAGFNVLTWDPRGFGASGGVAQVNGPDTEGRDVETLIDWVAAQPVVELDGPGDPRMGMVGGSYGGGIQLTVAAQDCRVDAIVPVIAWNSLRTSLYRSETVKAGWAGRLVDVASRGRLDPHITSAYDSGTTTGTLSPEDEEWFVSRGPAETVSRITAPTLIVGGTVDNLFTLDEAVMNFTLLEEAGTTVSMLWFCGGHGVCLTEEGDPERVGTAAIAWLRRYVAGDASVDPGPRIDVIDQHGARYRAEEFPLPTEATVRGEGSGTLVLIADGGSGPARAKPGPPGLVDSIALPITPAPAENAITVPVDLGVTSGVLLGAPELQLAYRGTTPPGRSPVRVFAQLVDQTTGVVVGNQVTPVPLILDGTEQRAQVPLETIIFRAEPGSRLALQLVAATVAYAEPRLGGSVTFDRVEVSIPVVGGLTPER
jgi:ABC-2 type transport system ATP-binding protein